MSEWQPIETASAVGKKRLLFWLAKGKAAAGYRLAGTKNVWVEGGDSYYLATHWMPLPEPPK